MTGCCYDGWRTEIQQGRRRRGRDTERNGHFPEELHGAAAVRVLRGWAGRGPGNYTHGCGWQRR